MNNLFHIENDGINVYSTLYVNANKTGIRILSLIIFIAVVVVITAVVKSDQEETIGLFFAGIAVFLLIILFPARYLL